MLVYRASRKPQRDFDPLDAAPSVRGGGWRYNDPNTPILYAASVQSLAILEVAARPGWHLLKEVVVATIEVPDGTIADLHDLRITLPTNWNMRPAAPGARSIGREFLAAVDREAAAGRTVCGVRVPSVLATADMNLLLDPRQQASDRVVSWVRIPFAWLLEAAT